MIEAVPSQRLPEPEIDRKLREVGRGAGEAVKIALGVARYEPLQHLASGPSASRSVTRRGLDGLKCQLAFGEYRPDDADGIDGCREAQDRDRDEEQFDDRFGGAAGIEKAGDMNFNCGWALPSASSIETVQSCLSGRSSPGRDNTSP
ncbi:hypothetical protein NKI76_30215 [Mesorhizobium sp. M0435]